MAEYFIVMKNEELKTEIERFIKYYNEDRIKEKLGWMSPVQYRMNYSISSDII